MNEQPDLGASELRVRPSRGPVDFAPLVAIWRSAVDATHEFLADADRDEVESRLESDYFPAVSLTVAELNGRPVGFAGVLDGNLEMLFIDAKQRGTGIGTSLLSHAINDHGVRYVDVNEQNPGACGFYLSRGFAQVGRDELDGDGRPYPTLHLELSE